jgi:hypothetical protein
MSKSLQKKIQRKRKKRLLYAIAHCKPFDSRDDLNIGRILAEGLKTMEEYPRDQDAREDWILNAVAACLEAIQHAVTDIERLPTVGFEDGGQRNAS